MKAMRAPRWTRVRGWIGRVRRRGRPAPSPPPLVPNPHPEMLDWMLKRIGRLRHEDVPVSELAEDCRTYLESLDPPPAIDPDVLARLLMFSRGFDADMFAMMLRYLALMETRGVRVEMRAGPR